MIHFEVGPKGKGMCMSAQDFLDSAVWWREHSRPRRRPVDEVERKRVHLARLTMRQRALLWRDLRKGQVPFAFMVR